MASKLATFLILLSLTAQAQKFTTVYSFLGNSGPPNSPLVQDAAGNLYGSTVWGGDYGHGSIFELTPNGDGTFSEKVLYSFTAQADGYMPGKTNWGTQNSGVVMDSLGNLYGLNHTSTGLGQVFKFSPNGQLSVFHAFHNDGIDGVDYRASLVVDKQDNLYGVTMFGGSNNLGVVYELAPDGTETILHNFKDDFTDGGAAVGLTIGPDGNLYGTTEGGGIGQAGTIFEIAAGVYSIVHAFSQTDKNGCYPSSPPVFDAQGNIYGSLSDGQPDYYFGQKLACNVLYGMIFKLSAGTETILYRFGPRFSAAYNLSLGTNGSFYGSVSTGGVWNYGGIFRITLGKITLLKTYTQYGRRLGGPLVSYAGVNLGTMGGGNKTGIVFSVQ